MKLGIQLHLTGLYLSNTVTIPEVFGVKRARSTVHNWVHKAEIQPENGRSPDHIAVDETMIRLNNEQYWLYTAVDPETNELLHTTLEPTTNKVLSHSFLTELAENMMWKRLCFSLMVHTHYKMRVINMASISDTNTWKSERRRTYLS